MRLPIQLTALQESHPVELISMELSLSRVDLLQVASTSRNNLKLLPLSKRSTQKVPPTPAAPLLSCQLPAQERRASARLPFGAQLSDPESFLGPSRW